MWTNPEINNSDAFIAAWLPGSEGNGVSDLLFRSDPLYDFKGRLSYSWPMTAEPSNGKNLFELGYGLTYEDQKNIELLPIASGLENKAIISSGEFFSKGKSIEPWSMWLVSGELEKQIVSYPTSIGGLIIKKTDHLAQEDALRINWTNLDSNHFKITSKNPSNMTRQSNGAMKLTFDAKSFLNENAIVKISLCNNYTNCQKSIELNIKGDWKKYKISLKSFEDLGADMSKIKTAFSITSASKNDIGINNIRLE